jgi:hypothetical protein
MSAQAAGLDAAAVAALLSAAGAPVAQERHADLVEAAAYVVKAGRLLAAAGVDHLPPLTPCKGVGDE